MHNTTAARRFVETMHKTQIMREAAQAAERAMAQEMSPEICRILLCEWANRLRSGNWVDRWFCMPDALPLVLIMLRCRLRLALRLTNAEIYFVEYYLSNADEVAIHGGMA
ncbi:MAG: hypothetical protein JST93_35010 [Acidobacteria bacterium]|nr:hypothetical protein [Acidobacteriota bacterium]